MRTKDEQKLKRLFASTLLLVEQVGLVGLTMALIAKEAKLAVGTTYLYFPTKQELVTALYKEVKQRFQQHVFRPLPVDAPVLETLRALWTNYLHYAQTNYREMVFLQQFNRSPYVREKETWLYAVGIMRPLTHLLAAGQQQGMLKPDPEQLTLPLLTGFIQELAAASHEQHLPLSEARVARSFQLFWDAIKQ
jgi:AcrR family transcriptional regulator